MGPFKQPESFDFSQPSSWPDWKQRFLRFRLASKLSNDPPEVQISALIFCMGSDSERIINSFNLSDDEENDFDTVLSKFDQYFVPKANIIHERAKFFNRSQKAGENIEAYLRVLYELAEHANFHDKEEAIRDRLVLGVLDTELSEKLQLQSDLTLNAAVTQARQFEQVKSQLSEQRQSLDAVRGSFSCARSGRSGGLHTHSGPRFNTSRSGPQGSGGLRQSRQSSASSGGLHQSRQSSSTLSSSFSSRKCDRCGRDFHQNPAQCPARNKTCRKCGKRNHFSVCCRSRRTDTVTAQQLEITMEEDDGETYFLGAVDKNDKVPPWFTYLNIHGFNRKFKIDTGADVSIMAASEFDKLEPKPRLQKTNAILKSPGGIMDCIGQFTTSVGTNKGSTYPLQIFVVNAQTDNLLSRSAASNMHLIKRIDNMEMSSEKSPFGDLDKQPIDCRPVKIRLLENSEPYSLSTARRIPIPLMSKVKAELERMKACGIIEEITDPTDWCAPMIPVLKKNNQVRICTDFKHLNKAVKRERYILPTLEDILCKLSKASIFSKLDATSGFFQIPLDDESAKLTTFLTPFGRYFYRRLPQGLSASPEIFQRTMETILQGQDHVICFFDDILIFSENPSEHEKHLQEVIKTLARARVKLNEDKCELRKEEIEFLGNIINGKGVRPDPQKISAISNLPEPSNIPELRRFLGMVNFLGRYLPNLSSVLQPINELLEKDKAWFWGQPQQQAFVTVKKMITSTPTLAYYDPSKPTMVSSDASSYGLGGVLLQDHGGKLRPVAYCSRTMNQAERKYAQIEKECLGAVYACERFERYLVGLPSFKLETDHRPLIPLINKKDLTDTPIRCQRMLIRLMRFNVTAVFSPGKDLVVADTLSRTPLQEEENQRHLQSEVQQYINTVRETWPITDARLEEIARETQDDKIMNAAVSYTLSGWPKYSSQIESSLQEFYNIRNELSVQNGILLRGSRLVIPPRLREDILGRIHDGHQGIRKCRDRAKFSVWWPGLSQQIKKIVQICRHCQESRPSQRMEPLIPSELPDRPFQRVAADILELKGQSYIVLIDYYSRYLEIGHLPKITTQNVISRLKNIFAHHGVPETLITDNGRQFTSSDFQTFASSWGFHHVTSSPYHAQGNGEAERAVRTAKQILVQDDPFLALLSYRATPTDPTRVSPAELAMGRRLRTTLPTLQSNLEPKLFNKNAVRENDAKAKKRNKIYFDRRHGAQTLPELHPGDPVLLKLDHESKWSSPASVLSQVAPRSYLVQTPSGSQYRRNRKHLRLSQSFPVSKTAGPKDDIPVPCRPVPSTPVASLPDPGPSRSLQSCPDDPVSGLRQAEQPPIQPSSPSVQSANQPSPADQTTQPMVPAPSCKTKSGRAVVPPVRFRNL